MILPLLATVGCRSEADTPIIPFAMTPRAIVTQPTRVTLPTVEVSAPLVRLGLDGRGGLQVPSDPAHAGWYELGPAPGQAGRAVIAGHLDSRTGPAVFFRLDQLQPGDPVVVSGPQGTVVFLVEKVEHHRKADFPTQDVYGPTAAPELTLITCGGTFDHSAGHYRENTIVFARANTGIVRLGDAAAAGRELLR